MATATAMATETAKVTAGDIGGGGGDTAIAAAATRQSRRRHGNRSDGDGHGGDDCKFFLALNLVEVRKANHQIKNIFRCTCTEYYSMNNGWGVV